MTQRFFFYHSFCRKKGLNQSFLWPLSKTLVLSLKDNLNK